MSRSNIHHVTVHFGDCDPADIVYFPNYSRWMDQASLAFFKSCGVPPWRDLEKTRGIVGAPLLEIHTRFLRPATYGDELQVVTTVQAWARKTFTHHHRVMRGEELLCEGTEVRAFVVRDPSSGRIRAIEIPEDLRALCS
jgi:4-hydroxybenzoyl-CoA thioesterase